MTKKVDFSLLGKFRITPGAGYGKEVCVMQAANILIAIAEGKTTLSEALQPTGSYGKRYSDSVTCVHEGLNNLCININDSLDTDKQRMAFAKKYLPLVLGTRGTKAQNSKIDKAFRQVDFDLESKLIEKGLVTPRRSLYKAINRYLQSKTKKFSFVENIRRAADILGERMGDTYYPHEHYDELYLSKLKLIAGLKAAGKLK